MDKTRVARRAARLTPLVPEERPVSYCDFSRWQIAVRPVIERVAEPEPVEGRDPNEQP